MAIPERDKQYMGRYLSPITEHFLLEVPEASQVMCYRIIGSSVFFFDLQPSRLDDGTWTEVPIAKFRYVFRSKGWRLYWMRGNGLWEAYEGRTSPDIGSLAHLVRRDEYGCFFG